MDELSIFTQIDRKKLSPLQAMRLLMSYPYINFVSQFFSRTREYETGLAFVDTCRHLLDKYAADIPVIEAQRIEKDITFMELSFYDALNLWQRYLDFFEHIFLEKRTQPYIAAYFPNPKENAEERFGRYLLGRDSKGLQVHKLYLHEHRRAIIKRKLVRQEFGKNVEHLKRHQKEQLSDEEYLKRVQEMKNLFEWMKKYH
nr:hypothetical protein [uncultured Acetatifactor sp.]